MKASLNKMPVKSPCACDFFPAHHAKGITVDQVPFLVFAALPKFFGFAQQFEVQLSNLHDLAWSKGVILGMSVER